MEEGKAQHTEGCVFWEGCVSLVEDVAKFKGGLDLRADKVIL